MQHSGFDLFGTFEEPSAEACGRVALENRKQSTHPLWKAEERQDTMLSTPPPPPPLLNFLGEKPPLRHTNGYSIAEILLVFGIIAGVLIGVWAMYTMLAEKTDVKAAVTEIQMLQNAAITYKNHSGTNNYSTLAPLALMGSVLPALRPYLGGSGLADGQNIFGESIDVYIEPYPTGENLVVDYLGVTDMDICRQILEHFGEVTEVSAEEFKIEPGKTISGYVGGEFYNTGCELGLMYITID